MVKFHLSFPCVRPRPHSDPPLSSLLIVALALNSFPLFVKVVSPKNPSASEKLRGSSATWGKPSASKLRRYFSEPWSFLSVAFAPQTSPSSPTVPGDTCFTTTFTHLDSRPTSPEMEVDLEE